MLFEDLQSTPVRSVDDGIETVSNAVDYFTRGRCAELAQALGDCMPSGKIIEVRTPATGYSALVHAGLQIGNVVIDIEGVSSAEQWAAKWLGCIGDSEVSFRVPGGIFAIYSNRRSEWIARTFAAALARRINADMHDISQLEASSKNQHRGTPS